MAPYGLLAPYGKILAFSVPKLGEGGPSISILRLKRPPVMSWLLLRFRWSKFVGRGAKGVQWDTANILNGNGPKEKGVREVKEKDRELRSWVLG